MTNSTGYTVGLVQMRMTPDLSANQQCAENRVREAARQGAQVICLPELYRAPYFCQKEDADLFDLAEPIDGASIDAFRRLAVSERVVVVIPFFERRAPGIYHNTAIVIDADGSTAGVYRKMHIPDDPAYYEKFYFTPGDLGFRAFNTAYGRIGVLICWDQWFPEGARLTALAGATTIFYPTAIGWHPQEKAMYGAAQRDAWMTVQRGHAVANGCYIAAVNRTGFEQPVPEQAGLEFWGSSFLADPQGQLAAEAAVADEEILIHRVDLQHLETIRRNWPFLRDRRIDAYEEITLRFRDERL